MKICLFWFDTDINLSINLCMFAESKSAIDFQWNLIKVEVKISDIFHRSEWLFVIIVTNCIPKKKPTLFLAQTSDPRSIRRSKYDVRLSLTAYINGVIPDICNFKQNYTKCSISIPRKGKNDLQKIKSKKKSKDFGRKQRKCSKLNKVQ